MAGKLKIVLNLLIIAICVNSQYIPPNYGYPYYVNPQPIYAPQPVSWPLFRPNLAIPQHAIPYPFYPQSNLNQSRAGHQVNYYYPYPYINPHFSNTNSRNPINNNVNTKIPNSPSRISINNEKELKRATVSPTVPIPTKYIDVPSFKILQGSTGVKVIPENKNNFDTTSNIKTSTNEKRQLHQIPAQIIIKDTSKNKDINNALKVISIPKITRTNTFQSKPITAKIVRTFKGNDKPEVKVLYMNADKKVVDMLTSTMEPETTTIPPETTTVDEVPVAINS